MVPPRLPRNHSGAENMASYRGDLKREELESLLALLASRHREQLPKPPALQGLVRQGAANGRRPLQFDEDSL